MANSSGCLGIQQFQVVSSWLVKYLELIVPGLWRLCYWPAMGRTEFSGVRMDNEIVRFLWKTWFTKHTHFCDSFENRMAKVWVFRQRSQFRSQLCFLLVVLPRTNYECSLNTKVSLSTNWRIIMPTFLMSLLGSQSVCNLSVISKSHTS